jgi:hypothetical protein
MKYKNEPGRNVTKSRAEEAEAEQKSGGPKFFRIAIYKSGFDRPDLRDDGIKFKRVNMRHARFRCIRTVSVLACYNRLTAAGTTPSQFRLGTPLYPFTPAFDGITVSHPSQSHRRYLVHHSYIRRLRFIQ